MKIYVEHDDGTKVDITAGVQVAYDIAVGSMDWGSGFLDSEEMGQVILLASACHFEGFEEKLVGLWTERQVEAYGGPPWNYPRKEFTIAERDAMLADLDAGNPAHRARVEARLAQLAADASRKTRPPGYIAQCVRCNWHGDTMSEQDLAQIQADAHVCADKVTA